MLRERILATAYELFAVHGVGPWASTASWPRQASRRQPSIGTSAEGCASPRGAATPRTARTRDWLEPRGARLASSPGGRLLAIFDALDEWFGQPDFEGCLFIKRCSRPHDDSSPVRQAAIVAIEHVYEVVQRLAEEAGY